MFAMAMRRRRDATARVPAVNLTSMMDMLSIILVFLLAAQSAEEQDFVLARHLVLPSSTSALGFAKAVQLKLTRRALMIEDTVIGRVRDGRLVGVKLRGDRIVPLYDLLRRYRESAEDAATTIVLQADRDFRFALLDKVMRTAAEAGFPNFRLAIQKE